MQNTDAIVILSARRTPIGRFLGSLSRHTSPELGVVAMQGALGSVPDELPISRVVIGCARQAGAGPNPARQVAIKGGLPETTVSKTVNMACASGMEAILEASRQIRLGEADVAIAGGMESMSRVPFLAENFRTGYRLGNSELVDGMYRDGFLCPLADQLMGATAETLARQYEISRDEQDRFAKRSQDRAVAAKAAGRFDDELVPVPSKKNADELALTEDEHVRTETSVEGLGKLKPVFADDGSVTAGNSSGITDGAAALVLARESFAKERGLPILARILDAETAGVDPKIMGIGPVPSVRAMLGRRNMKLEEIDLVELNEAFAAQAIAVDRELGFDPETLNVNGGSIALGHPIGCTGARITVTLLHELRRRGGGLGLATLCVSGGMGASMLFEVLG